MENKTDFIVQNVRPGHHCVSDINMIFAPFEIKDLTFESGDLIKKSHDLRSSLQNGLLRKISRADATVFSTKKAEKEQKEMRESIKRQEQRNARDEYGKPLTNVELTPEEELEASNYATDPRVYAMAYSKANTAAQREGRYIDPEVWANFLETNRHFNVREYLVSDSDDLPFFAPQKNIGTVLQAGVNGSYPEERNMQSSFLDNIPVDAPLGESIDLDAEDADFENVA